MDHLQACPYCPKYIAYHHLGVCSVYADTSWVNRRGGCPLFPQRDMTGSNLQAKKRVGQQKQKFSDRSYNNSKSRRKYGVRTI